MGEFLVHHIRFFDFVPQAVQCLAYQGTCTRLAVSRTDGSIEIWNVDEDWFQEKVIVPSNDNGSIEAMVWCGQRLFSAGLDGSLTEYDLARLIPKYIRSSIGGAIWCLACDSSQSQIATGTEEGLVVIFNITEEGPVYEKTFDRQEGRILSIAWHKDKDIIVTGGIDNIRLWKVKSGRTIQRLTLGRQEQNKETLVWSIAITEDLTIVSGDSRGKTSFWNGNQGTLIKAFQSHKADVLAVCVNKEGTRVFSSGIDPSLVEFEFSSSQVDSDWRMWVPSSTRCQHTHDVRALTFAGESLVSGGVDCSIIFNQIDRSKGSKYWRRLPLIPHKQLVHTSKDSDLVLLQYSDYLELWKLGESTKLTGEHAELLPLRQRPVKLLMLKSKSDRHIVCCAISNTGSHVVYSDSETVYLYEIDISQDDGIPLVGVNRIKFKDHEIQPAHLMTFDPVRQRLILACQNGCIQLINTEDKPSLCHTFQSAITSIHTDVDHSHCLMCVSTNGKYLATAGLQRNIHIYNMKKNKFVCSLPQYPHQATAMAINPTTMDLVVAFADQRIYEYNIVKRSYTEWSKRFNESLPHQWLRRHSKINTISFLDEDSDKIVLQDDQMIGIIDKTQPFPGKNVKLFKKFMREDQESDKKEKSQHCFHLCQKYKHVLYAGTLKDNWLVVVECPPLKMAEKLPPSLRQKKFGT